MTRDQDDLHAAIERSIRRKAKLAEVLGNLNDDQVGTLLDAVAVEAVGRARRLAKTAAARRLVDKYAALGERARRPMGAGELPT